METFNKFSRPVFRLDLVDEFKDAVHALGLVDWAIVREKLYSTVADEVIQALKDYKDAVLLRIEHEQDLDYEYYLKQEYYAYDSLCRWSMWTLPIDAKEYNRRIEDWKRANL